MTDLQHTLIERLFAEYGTSVKSMTPIEPMMDGYMCTVELDSAAEGLGERAKGVRISTTQMREGRQWHTILGRAAIDGWNAIFQGEWGTYGLTGDMDDILRLQVWIGQCDVPADVEYSFALEHDGQIASAATLQIHMATEALSHVSDEALARASSGWVIEGAMTQIRRLQKAK